MNTSLDQFSVSAPIIWVIIGAVFAIAEIISPTFGLMFFAAGAGAAAVAAYFDFNVSVQIGVCIGVSLASLWLLRRLFMEKFGLGDHGVPSRTEVLHGKVGKVTHAIEPHGEVNGRVLVEGQDWSATASEKIPVGTQVKVDGADGIVLRVSRT